MQRPAGAHQQSFTRQRPLSVDVAALPSLRRPIDEAAQPAAPQLDPHYVILIAWLVDVREGRVEGGWGRAVAGVGLGSYPHHRDVGAPRRAIFAHLPPTTSEPLKGPCPTA